MKFAKKFISITLIINFLISQASPYASFVFAQTPTLAEISTEISPTSTADPDSFASPSTTPDPDISPTTDVSPSVTPADSLPSPTFTPSTPTPIDISPTLTIPTVTPFFPDGPISSTTPSPFPFENPTPYVPSAQIKYPIELKPLPKLYYGSREIITVRISNASPEELKITGYYHDLDIQLPIKKIPLGTDTLIKILPPTNLLPGKYTLFINTDNKSFSQIFYWGMLVLNTDKSAYAPGETVRFGIAVFDDQGQKSCDAKLSLKITSLETNIDEELSTEDGEIAASRDCRKNITTTKADFEAIYQARKTGKYKINLTAQTSKNTFNIYETIEVSTDVPFVVQRKIPTYALGQKSFPVKFQIRANQEFTGQIYQTIPDDSVIVPQPGVRKYDDLVVGSYVPDEDAFLVQLGMPFAGDFLITLGFGQELEDPEQKDLYQKFGLAGHDGVDYALPEGTPVMAVDDGEIVLAGPGDYGNTVVIKHSWGKSYYGHLSSIDVNLDQKVTKAEQIALSGSSGLAIGAHLHFGIKLMKNNPENGYYGKIDPLPFLSSSAWVSDYSVKRLVWNISLKKGEKINLGYDLEMTDPSSQLVWLGPLEFMENGQYTFRENRGWQISINMGSTAGAHFPREQYSQVMEKLDRKFLEVDPDYARLDVKTDKELRFSVNDASRNKHWLEILPDDTTQIEADHYDGYIERKIVLKNLSSPPEFTFTLNTDPQTTIGDLYGGSAIGIDTSTQEELFMVKSPQGIDADGQRIDYKYELSSGELRLFPTSPWQLDQAVYPITIYVPVMARLWDEALVKVGENCFEAGCEKDGDIVDVKPAGWNWGAEERKQYLIVKVPKKTILEREKLTRRTIGRIDEANSTLPEDEKEMYREAERQMSEEEKEYLADKNGMRLFGIDYTRLVDDKMLLSIRRKDRDNIKIDKKFDSKIIERKKEPQASIIPSGKRLAFKQKKPSLFDKFVRVIIPTVSAATTVVKSIGTATGRDFSTIGTWESTQNGDLVTADTVQKGIAYNDSTFDEVVTIDGSTTDATRYMWITVPPGHRHNGTAGSGVKIISTTTATIYAIFSNLDSYTLIEWIDMTNNSANNLGGTAVGSGIGSTGAGGTNITIRYNIVHTLKNRFNTRCISSGAGAVIYNNFVYDCNVTGAADGSRGIQVTGGTGKAYNNTIYNIHSQGLRCNSATTDICENNVAMGSAASLDFQYIAGATANYNMSSDATADDIGGTGHLISKTASNQFISTTTGSENLHLKSGADAINAGKSLSSTFTDDIDETARPQGSAWDMGADEFSLTRLDILMRHGKYFSGSGVRQPFTF